jgi:release factor glutamine methyltransferase
MTARGLYLHFIEKLQQVYEKGEAAAITKLVYDYYKIDSKKNNQLATETISLLNNKLDDLLMHKPVQYVLGEAWFYNMYFTVNEHVLIPRPETEELVELAIQCVQRTSSIVHILDIGTGSGCIPVTIKKNVPPAVVYAIDISKDAIAVAKKNAVANNTVVNFLQHDFLNENNWKDLPVFDIIISNPPYIPINEKKYWIKM